MSKSELYAKLRSDLPHNFYYECYTDLIESFDGIYDIVGALPYQAAFDFCLGFLCRRDAYYNGTAYIKDLNKELNET